MRFYHYLLIIGAALLSHAFGFSQTEAEKKAVYLKHLTEIHLKPVAEPAITQQIIDRLIEKTNKSDLSFDEKFDLRYYLTQLSYLEDINGLPAPTLEVRNNLLDLTTDYPILDLLESVVFNHFKKESLPYLLQINESDIQNLRLNEDHFYLEELLEYDFPPQARVGEIGGGDGLFGLLLKMMHDDIQLLINEISSERLGEIRNSLLVLPEDMRQEVTVVFGAENSTQMEGKELDAILMRNVFHHFSEPEAMMKSIRQSLKVNGLVYLLEQFKEEEESNNHCNQLKERSFFEDLFRDQGWMKIKEVYLKKQRKHLQVYQIQ